MHSIRGVKTAFFAGYFLPPPTAFAFVLIGQHGPGAGLTADTDISFFVQGVIGHIVFADIGPHLGGGPGGERIELDQTMVDCGKDIVLLNDWKGGAGSRTLVTALARNLGLQGVELAPQGGDLSYGTAFAMTVVIKTEQTLVSDQRLKLTGLWRQDL